MLRLLLFAALLLTASAASAQTIAWERAVRPFPVVALDGETYPYPFAGGFVAPRPHLVDLDGDGDADLVVNEGGKGLCYYAREAGAPGEGFAWQTDALQADGDPIAPGTWSAFGDLDGDGDEDLLTQGAPGRVRYYRNDGSAQTWQFSLAADTLMAAGGGPVTNEDTSVPSLYDVDGDGDLDFLHGQADRGHITYWRNDGISGGLPQLTFVTQDWEDIEVFEPNPSCEAPKEGAIGTGRIEGRGSLHGANALTFVDLDGDGDGEMFWGDFFARSLFYFLNEGTSTSPDLVLISELFPLDEPLTSGGYNVPNFGDTDDDGDPDLVIGILGGLCSTVENRFDNLYLYENVGTPTDAEYMLRNERLIEGIDVGARAVPALRDLDGDGDLDLVVGNDPLALLGSQLTLFLNEGSADAPSYRLSDPDWLSLVYDFGAYAPVFGDLDDDGDDDLLVGGFNGRLAFLERTGSGINDYTLREERFENIDVGQYIRPTLGDLDGDGDLDLVTGESNGFVKVYRNVGTPSALDFLTEANGSPVAADLAYRDAIGIPDDIGSDSAPSLYDLDGDGDLDLTIGTNEGPLRVFVNTGTPTAPQFTEEDAVPARRPITVPAFGDLDDDGDPDLLAGTASGGLMFFSNGTFTTDLGDAGPSLPAAPSLRAYPNPSSAEVAFRLGGGERLDAPALIVVYDTLGRSVARLPVASGAERVAWYPPAGMAAGTYLAQLEQAGEVLAMTPFTRIP